MTTDLRKTSSAPPLVAFLVAGTFFMENLDGTVIATALPRMADSFSVSAVSLNAGITAYLLTLAVFIPVSGWVADRFGARTVFTAAIAVFTASSVLCGLSNSLDSFIALRIIQGIGGALMVPVGRLAVLRSTPKEGLVKAIAAITWPGLVAPLLGPPVGGFLVTYASWRWIFYLNLPLGLLAIGLAWAWVENTRPETHRPFDWMGFLTSGLGILGLMYAVELAALDVVPWGRAGVSAAVGIVMSWVAIRHLRRSAAPMLDLTPIRFQTFAVTVAGGSCFRVAIGAVPFLLPLMLQVGFGFDAFHSGLLTLTTAAGTLVMKPLTTPLLRRFGFRICLIAASLATAGSLLATAGLTQATPTALMVAILFAGGFARSLQFTSYNTIAFVDVPRPTMSAANTVYSTALQLSLGLGVGLGAIVVRGLEWLGWGAQTPGGAFRIAFAVVAALAAAAVIDCWRLPNGVGRQVLGRTPA